MIFTKWKKKQSSNCRSNNCNCKAKMNRLGGKIVEMKKVYKSYGDKVILKGFDYTFKRGERVGIVGKNGAGKSTLLNILQGIENSLTVAKSILAIRWCLATTLKRAGNKRRHAGDRICKKHCRKFSAGQWWFT